jgi:phosphohistidine swiveling domain-containing protein
MSMSLDHRTAEIPEPWDAPVEDGPVFTFDPMHAPYPVSPMEQSYGREVVSVGFTNGLRELGLHGVRREVFYRNFHQYDRIVVPPPPTEEAGREMGATIEANLTREIGRLRERWETEHLPRIKELLARHAALKPDEAPEAELPGLVDEAFAIQQELWTIHFRIVPPQFTALQLFDELHADLFDGVDGSALTAGQASESVKAGLALGDLAASARELGLGPLLRDTPAAEVMAELAKTAAGRAWLDQMSAYLATYGFFQDLYALRTPTWREDPSCLLGMVRSYLISGYDPKTQFEARSAAAADAEARARAALAAYPESVRAQFDGLLAAARSAAFLHEEHNYYIDQQGETSLRRVLVAIGRRLAEDGRLADPDDIFMLTRDELSALLAAPETAGSTAALIDRRREEMRRARAMTPPSFIGPRPPSAPPLPDSPLLRGLGRFFTPPPRQAETANQLKGAPASIGIVTGRARVARTLNEATALQPGEILIAVTTMPAWTPLFGIAAAVVTETGGPLSHCAVVAREYGIPAVVGVHAAASAIQSGQLISVDGGLGLVTLVEPGE